jgi:hypothetical protein
MRNTCKNTDCSNQTDPSVKPGARHVYCVPCDRQAARDRMRKVRASKAAKQATAMYYRPKHGYVYIVYNPVFFGWVKVGCALDAEDRLKTFQTADPHRAFELRWSKWFEDKLGAETKAHDKLTTKFERRGEWFKAAPWQVKRILERM